MPFSIVPCDIDREDYMDVSISVLQEFTHINQGFCTVN